MGKKTYDIEFSVTKVSPYADVETAREVVYNFIMDLTGEANNKYGYLIVGKRLFNSLRREIKGSFVEEGSPLEYTYMWGCLLMWDRRCKKDTIYMMTSNENVDLYGKVKAMFSEIRKLDKKGLSLEC